MLKTYKPYIIFSLFIIFGLGAFFFVSNGYYPILSVNSHFVSARTFWKNYQADTVYYQNYLKVYQTNLSDKEKEILNTPDLKSSVLTELIENILIDDEAEKQLGRDLDQLVRNRIENIKEDDQFKKTAEVVYGLKFEDFQNEILVPLAKQEILAGRLFLRGQKLDDWLLEAKKGSRVKVFSGQFSWDGKDVHVNK